MTDTGYPLVFLFDKLGSLPLDGFEIYQSETRLFLAQSNEGEVELTEEALERGVAIRLFKGGKASFACSSDWTPPFLERMIDLSYNSLSVLEEGDRFELPAKNGGTSDYGSWGPSPSSSASRRDKLEAAVLLETETRKFDHRIVRVRDARYSEETRHIRLKNSRGIEGEFSRTLCELSAMVMAEEGGNQEMAWEEEFSDHFEGIHPREMARRVAEKAVSQLGAQPVKTQKVSVILDPVVGASFLGILASSFFADQVQRNRSALRGRLGEKIYSDRVSLVDDGRYAGGVGTAPFDGEGFPTQKNELVNKGTLRQFLYDARSATLEGRESTGNGIRPHFKEQPRVGATNFYVVPGEASLEGLFSSMGRGLWIRDVIGMHTADSVTGDFSVGASGIWIENGRKNNPVRGITVSGNLHELFAKVVEVGSELRFYRSYGCPPLWVEALDIGGL